jgi:hypothetical protein
MGYFNLPHVIHSFFNQSINPFCERLVPLGFILDLIRLQGLLACTVPACSDNIFLFHLRLSPTSRFAVQSSCVSPRPGEPHVPRTGSVSEIPLYQLVGPLGKTSLLLPPSTCEVSPYLDSITNLISCRKKFHFGQWKRKCSTVSPSSPSSPQQQALLSRWQTLFR